jgi:hypothetical protein
MARFLTRDPLEEKYYWNNPYVYCNNNPIRYVDLHGDSITVVNNVQDFTNAIYNGLANGQSLSMKFNNGVLDPTSIKEQAENTDDFFVKDLYELASNQQMVEISFAKQNTYMNNGNKVVEGFGQDPYDYSTLDDGPEANVLYQSMGEPTGRSFNGNTGQFLIPGNSSPSGRNSTSKNIQIIINANGSLNHQTVGMAHEFGHAILYLRGLPHIHGADGVDVFIYSRALRMSQRLGYDF